MAQIDREVLVGEFLDLLHERAEAQYSGRLHQAFVDWYIDAEFGRVDWKFTDGNSDGGIDAVVWLPDEKPAVAVLQSKFTENVGRSMLSVGAYREFNRVVDAFYRRDDVFDEFLSPVLVDVRRIYRKALSHLEGAGDWRLEKKAFRLITTHNHRRGERIDRLSPDCLHYADDILRLYQQYRRGATPRARPLQLTTGPMLEYKDKRRQVTSYLCNARLADFRRYLDDNDVARLVARNIRYNLAGKVGRAIRRSYEETPLDFWYCHNGITIVCDKMTIRDGIATLFAPSVINGAQTLYAVSDSSSRTSPALVTARMIVRGANGNESPEDDVWLQNVIRGVNTQNRVKPADFWSNEPEQFELQHRFREVGVFYERKRGEWREFRNEPRFKGFGRVSLSELGSVLTAGDDDGGEGVLRVKKGQEHVFAEKNYRRLFPSRSKVARRFESIYLAYCLCALLYDHGYQNSRTRNKQRHAFWNCLWLLTRGVYSVDHLHSHASIRSIQDTFNDCYSGSRDGRRARKTMRELTKHVWAAWRLARRADPERWTPNNFFKSRHGNHLILRKAYTKAAPALRQLARQFRKS